MALIICLLVVSITAGVQSRIDTGPMNALNKSNDTVTLKCVTDKNNCEGVEWSKQEGEQSPNLVYRDVRGMLNSNKYPPERYSVNPTGGCHLTITQLEIGDSGKFTCMHRDAASVEFTRMSVLVVIGVTESCLLNITSGALVEGDVYSIWTAISVPAKSVEPSDVTLSFQNKALGETETPDSTQSNTVKTTLTGTATTQKIENRTCRASFTPKPQDHIDSTTATLDICAPQPLIVSFSVRNIAVDENKDGGHYKGDTVRCTAEGYPLPTFNWTNSKNAEVLNGTTLVIQEDAGTNYTCTATNMVKGKAETKSITIQVSPPSESSNVAAIVICIIVGFGLSGASVAIVVCWKRKECPLYNQLNDIDCGWCPLCPKKDKKDPKRSSENSSVPLTGPVKPPRASDAPNRPTSECAYAELRPDPDPRQMKRNPVDNSTTHYASVALA